MISIFQVLASELTTGYENLSNLQLYKINGIAILNLKHLASILDLITGPLLAKAQPKDSNLTHEETQDTNDSTSVDLGCSENNKTCQHALHEREQAQVSEEDCSTSRNPRDEMLQGKSSSTTCESRCVTKERPGTDNIVPASGTVTGSEKVSTEGVCSHIPSLREGHAGLEDDPTLLSREDYLHFELDKDKIIVLHILSACKHSPDILKQYAIGQSRSDDLRKTSQ